MLPIVTFTGFSDSGKTTVAAGVIAALAAKGYKVASIKHDGHGHELHDDSGADSARHKAAGAVCSIVSNAQGYLLICDAEHDNSPQELAALAPANTDIVICEGFKKAAIAKIEVHRSAAGNKRTNEGDPWLVATASDIVLADSPHQLNINDHAAIADFIEARFLKVRPDIALHLIVDGKHIPTKDFIMQMLTHSIHGLIKPLKGCENPKEIVIKAVYKD
ncbi:MAG: molybdopterin-guanine dinucleotide biosynthesis protein B [Deferribacteraceae bacterium]|jgi:molybdopterin-guanine dinucleotide biosynthesis protein B|nr:molybdopterin-guanine dinucleotide biosynthesis protein B [Deferribacteraceae bacterium]